MSDTERGHAWAENAAPFALGALDADERRAFEDHLSSCAICQAEVAAYRDVVANLAFAAPDKGPPLSLRQRVLDGARAVRPIRTARAGFPLSAKRERGSFGYWLAVASVGLALIALGAYLSERNWRVDLEQSVAGLTDTLSARDAELARLGSAIAQRDSVLAAVLAADVQTTRLTAEGRPPSARIYWNARRGRVVVAVFDLSPAPAGRTYQLWGIADGAAVSLGTFNTASDGSATATFSIDPALTFQAAAVTEEPAGGSPQPTTTPFLSGQLGRT